MEHKISESILKDYIKHVITEKFLRIDDEEYYVTAAQLNSIKAYLTAQSQIQNSGLKKMSASFTIEDAYQDFLNQLATSAPKLSKDINDAVNKSYPEQATRRLIKRLLVDSDILNNTSIQLFQPAPTSGGSVKIPKEVINIAEFSYSQKAGAMRGKGEFLIPLLFADSNMLGGNDLIDVTIAGENWHVKARDAAGGSKGARMGSAPNVVFQSTNIHSELVKAGVSASTFGEMGMQKFRSNLPNFAKALGTNGGPQRAGITPEKLYDLMNEEAVHAAMVPGQSPAKGICFYEAGKFLFVPKEKLFFYGTTQQGRIILSYDASVKQKILGVSPIRGSTGTAP